MTTQQIQDRYFRSATRILQMTRAEMQQLIKKLQLPIRANQKTTDMRSKLIDRLREARDKQLAKLPPKIIQLPQISEAELDQILSNLFETKPEKAYQISYFTTYKIILIDEDQHDTHSTEYYTTITANKTPAIEDIRDRVQELIDYQNANRTYRRIIHKIKRVDALNVQLVTKEQRKAFKTLTTGRFLDDKDGFKYISEEFLKLTKQFKLRTKIYRQICKINGIPDIIDRGDNNCAVNFLTTDLGYSRKHVECWWYEKSGLEYFPPRDWTADDLYDFAVEHQRSCFLLDRRRYCFKHYTGTSHQRDLYAVIEDNHVYPITDESARRKIREMMKSSKSKKFTPRKSKKSIEMETQIVSCMTTDDLENIDKPTEFIVTDAKDLDHALKIFLDRKQIPDIKVIDGKITKISFENTHITHNPEFYKFDGIKFENTPVHTSSGLAQLAYNKLIETNPQLLSPIFGTQEAVTKAKYHIKEPINGTTHFGIDFSKFYYHAAMSIPDNTDIPIFAIGSPMEQNHLTDLNAHYVVETQDWQLLRGPGIYTGEIIARALKAGIPHVITHILRVNSTLKWKVIKDALQEIVQAHDGDLAAAKFAIVKFIGLFAQSVKKTRSSYIIPQSTQDASSLFYYYLDELSRGKDVHIHPNWSNTGHHLLTATKLEDLTMNAGPVHRMILNRSFEIIYDYITAMSDFLGKSAWDRLSAIKTDCLIFKRELWNLRDDLVELTMSSVNIPSKIELPRSCDTCDITTTFDKNTISVKKLEIISEDEVSFEQITEMIEEDIKAGTSIRIEGIAGAGKSTIVNELIKKIPDIQVITAAPDWVSAKQIGGKTLHSEFNLGETTVGWLSRVKKVQKDNTVLVVDETSKVDNDLCAVIRHIKQNCLSFVALGDHTHQMLPVQRGKVSNEDSINALVDKIYQLTVCKRATDTQKPALKAMQTGELIGYNDIKYQDLSDLADQFIAGNFKLMICRDNQMKVTLNELIAYKLYEQNPLNVEYGVTLQTRTTKSKWIDYEVCLYPMMQLIAIKNNKSHQIVKTQRVLVKTFSDTHVTLMTEDNKDLTLTYKQLYGYFDLGYVINAYNSQSATYNFKHIIVQTDDMDARAKYVTLTRATAKDLIYIATSAHN